MATKRDELRGWARRIQDAELAGEYELAGEVDEMGFGAIEVPVPPLPLVDAVPGCFAKAGMDEPLFILRAKDASAPAVVRNWVREARAYGTLETKLREALALADAMEAWQAEHGSKVPD